MFNKIKTLLGFDKAPELQPTFIVKSKHRDTSVINSREFSTGEELDAFMQGYEPTAWLCYATTEVFACYGKKQELVELHQHITGNISFEEDKFEQLARELGAEVTEVVTYPNESSAVSSVVRLSYD